MNRVVITGLGVFSAAGKSVPEFWETVRDGRSVIGPLTIIDTSDLHIKIGAEIRDFDPKAHAVYYVRVIEIPTPRWTTYDAVRNGLPLLDGVPATIQERAWTSPIWYTPRG